MRSLLILAVLLVCVSSVSAGAGPALNPTSASILLHLHPRPWHPAAPLAGLRTDVDPVGDGLAPSDEAAFAAIRDARARALADVRVQMRPDGSGYAVLGGLLRAYAIARIGPGGRLVEDCAHSEADALERLRMPAPPAAAPEGK